MSKFKVGDKVKGTKQASEVYRITNEDMLLGEITHIYEYINGIDIKVLKHKDKENEGKEFYCYEDSYFELVQPKQFTTYDLKERWLVKYRDGSEGVYLGGLPIKGLGTNVIKSIKNGKFMSAEKDKIDNYLDENLLGYYDIDMTKRNPNGDVVEVFKPRYESIWKRVEEQAKKMTVADIQKELGYKVEIVE